MAQPSPAVLVEVTDSIAIIRFNRPAERNPLSRATLQELKTTLAALLARDDIEVIIFTGTGDVFLSGAHIRELSHLDSDSALEFARSGQSIFQTIADADQTTIAAVNGYCMGGGLDLALACDIRVASESAVFSHPGARLGIITGWGGTQRLPRLVGTSRALELFATARLVKANEALRIGLVQRLGDPVLDLALQLGDTAILPDCPATRGSDNLS